MDYKTTIIGRRHEQDLIREYYDSPKAELVAVYGRRRVGKTYLIKQCFDETLLSLLLAQFNSSVDAYPVTTAENSAQTIHIL